MTEDFYYTIEDGVLRLSSNDGEHTATVYQDRWGSVHWPWTDNDDIYEVVIEDDIAPTTCNSMFSGLANLTTIEGLENLDTSNVTNMSCMFFFCLFLTSLDLSNLDTSHVTDMSDMFSGCEYLETVTTSDKRIISETPTRTKVVEPTARVGRGATPSLEATISQFSATAEALQAAVTALQGNIDNLRETLGSDPR